MNLLTHYSCFGVMEALSCADAFTFDRDFAVAGFTRWSLDGRHARDA